MDAISNLSDEQLVHGVFQAERDLVAARFKHSMNQLESTAKLRDLRRNIARLRTEARKRERAAGTSAGSLVSQHASTFKTGGPVASAAAEKGGFLSGIVDKLTGKD